MFTFKKDDTKKLELKKQELANNQVRSFVDRFRLNTLKLINKMEFSKASDELIPPWIVCIHPKEETIEKECLNYKDASHYWPEDWYWYGGEGGTYWGKYFLPFFDSLSVNDRKEYFRKYDLGREWIERDLWLFDILDDDIFDNITKKECEDAYNELSDVNK